MAFSPVLSNGRTGLKEAVQLALCMWLLVNEGGRAEPSGSGSARKLQNLKRPIIQTIQIANGDVYDCVDTHKQPAFDHPLLKNHTLQIWPSSYPIPFSKEGSPDGIFLQVELENGGCPEGTVPVQRLHNNTPKRANRFTVNDSQHFGNYMKQGHAVMEMKADDYYGGQADLNIYGLPEVKFVQDSTTTMWLDSYGSPSETIYNSIEAGWIVGPEIFGDTKTRLYVYWTADGYQKTGCYNLQCPGFVQVNRAVTLGMPLSPLSDFGGKQYVVTVSVHLDQKTGNWWFAIGKTPVGYWPKELFNNFNRARSILYGGLVDYPATTPSPPMGNGVFAEDPYDDACYIGRPRYMDATNTLHDPSPNQVFSSTSDPACYTVGPFQEIDGQPGYMFYFGGPGKC